MSAEFGDSFEIRVIADAAGFDSLEPGWEALHSAADASVFQSFTWLRTWWRHFGEDFPQRQLHIVAIHQEGRLAAIAPFYIESKRLSSLARMRTLRFVGTGISDHLDVILLPGREDALLRALAGHLGNLWKSLDSLSLVEIPDESPVRQILGRELLAAGVKVAVEECDRCPRVPLGATWPDTLAAMRGDNRRRLRSRTERLAGMHAIGYECIDDGGELEEAMTEFVAMHQERLGEKVGRGIYAEERMERFHREACRRFHERGWLFLSFMTLDGKRVLGNCYYLSKGRAYCHVGGALDVGDAWKHSPGIVFESLCIQEAIRRGAGIYDFLRGTEEYKYRFGAVDFPNWRIEAARVRLRVRFLGVLGSRLGALRRRMKSFLLKPNASENAAGFRNRLLPTQTRNIGSGVI